MQTLLSVWCVWVTAMTIKQRISVQRAKKILARMTSKQCQYVVRNANNSVIRRLASAAKAIRYRPLSSNVRRKLGRYRKTLRLLANPRASIQSKRKVLMRQKGGEGLVQTLATLVPMTVLPIVAGTLLMAMGRDSF